MSPLPVIENCFRVTWNFASYAGVTPRIVQHFRTTTADGEQLGSLIWAAIRDGMFLPMHAEYEPQSLSIIRLDGTSATIIANRPSGDGIEMCQGGGEVSPASACVMSWRSLIRGPKGRGRSYIGPLCEPNMANGHLVGDALTDMPAAWEDFLVTLGASDPSVGFVIASYKHAEAYLVQNGSLGEILATQRRRQNQLR